MVLPWAASARNCRWSARQQRWWSPWAAAVLFPYVRSMIDAVISADEDHEKFLVAAESSLDAFYILESVRDDAKNIVDFRFTYVNANGEQTAWQAAGGAAGRRI